MDTCLGREQKTMRTWTPTIPHAPARHHRVVADLFVILAMTIARMALADDPKLDTPQQKEAPTAFAAAKPSPVQDWGTGDGKSYGVPAYEIPGLRVAAQPLRSLRGGFRGLRIAAFEFPRQPAPQMGGGQRCFRHQSISASLSGRFLPRVARSSGLDFWQSSAYTFGRQLALGIRRRDHTALHQRSSGERHRRKFPRRTAVPHGEPASGKRSQRGAGPAGEKSAPRSSRLPWV